MHPQETSEVNKASTLDPQQTSEVNKGSTPDPQQTSEVFFEAHLCFRETSEGLF